MKTNKLTKRMINKVEKITNLKIMDYSGYPIDNGIEFTLTLTTNYYNVVGGATIQKYLDNSYGIISYNIGNVKFYLSDNEVYYVAQCDYDL